MRRAGKGGGPLFWAVVALGAVALGPFVQAWPVAQAQAAPMVVYVGPSGTGTACTSGAPCSLTTAQDKVRSLDWDMQSDIDVVLGGGTYALGSPLVLGPEDSGTNGYDVVYEAAPGTRPILSGGREVTGWSLVPGTTSIFTAQLPPGFDTAQLYVDGRSAPMSQGLPSSLEFLQSATGFVTSSDTLATWPDISSVAAVFTGGNGAWTQTSCPIASASGDVVTMAEPCWDNLHLPGEGIQELSWVDGPQGGFGGLSPLASPSFLENAYELLTPGSWSIDRGTEQLYYMAMAGQDVSTMDFVVPALQTLLSVSGTLSDPVHDIEVEGLQFSYGTWTGADTDNGFAEMQADWTLTGPGAANSEGTCQYSTPPGSCPFASWTRTPANVVLGAARDVALEDDVFSDLGGAGLDVYDGSQYDVVQGDEFTDIAASAIQLGATDDPLPSDVGASTDEIVADDTIADNVIQDVADQYLGGVGIWLGYTEGSVVTHNQIDYVPYTAISIGWGGWHTNVLDPDSDPNVNADNVISDNLMYDYMTTLGDGGAIYTNGGQAPGWADALVESGNVAYAGLNTDFSLYTDTGSQYVVLEDNAVYDQPEDSFATGGCHTVGHIRITGNYFSELGPLYPCDAVVDVESYANQLVCSTIEPGQVPDALLGGAGLEAAYRWLIDGVAPTVTAVGPSSLSESGGRVLVSGSGFQPGATAVTFGSLPASSVQVLSGNYLLATAPAGTGQGTVTVTTPAGTSAPSSSAVVSWQSIPTPCLPLYSGNFSTALVP